MDRWQLNEDPGLSAGIVLSAARLTQNARPRACTPADRRCRSALPETP